MDSEIIDLTDESKDDLNISDSRYGMIEDSIIDSNNLSTKHNQTEIKLNKIESTICLDETNEIKLINDENNDKINLIDENNLFSNENNISMIENYDQKSINRYNKIEELDLTDDDSSIEMNQNNNKNEFTKLDYRNYHNKSNESIKSNNLSRSNESIKSNNNLSKSNELLKSIKESFGNQDELNKELIDNQNDLNKENDILELDNELSVLYVVTPEKVKLNRAIELFNSPIDSPNLPKLTNLKRNLVETSFNQEIQISDLDDDIVNRIENPFDKNKRKQKRRTKLTDEERKAKELEKLKEKELRQAEKAELTKQKNKEKAKDKLIKEANKYLNLKNSSQYCTTVISQLLIDKFLSNDQLIRKIFDDTKLNLSIENISTLPLIKWRRILYNRNDQLIEDRSVLNLDELLIKEQIEEDQLILILNKDQFVKMVYKFVLSTNEQPEELYEFNNDDPFNLTLINYIEKLINEFRKSFILIIYNLESYFRSLKNREHRDFLQLMNDNQQKQRKTTNKSQLPLITRTNVEESILNTNLELMKNDTFIDLNLKIKFQFADNQTELINLIVNFSNSMADAPYRRARNKQEGFEWFVDGDSKTGSVNLKDLKIDCNRLWLKHLLLFDKVSLQIAKSITQIYPNLMSLKDKYDSLNRLEDKEQLLSKITIQNSNRTINLDISKRIFRFLNETNEDNII